jgi:FAD/FMN-containing dehydrogenase
LGSAALARAVALPTHATPLPAAPLGSPLITLTGRIIWPQDPDYDAARQVFNARISRFPAAIVICDDVEDAQNAVRWARQQGIELRVRSGGHSYEGFSTVDGGLVIDVSGLNDVRVDTSRGEAEVGAGVQLLELYRGLWEHGVTLPGGTCPGVGIAGLTLGGGVGYLSRQYGLTCDNLLAVELVDAEGSVLRASEREHADLFWALRGGGGGNFGIATAFTFRVHAIADVGICTVTWPWDDVAEVLDTWQHWAPFADERLTVGFVVPDPSQDIVVCSGQFNGTANEMEALLAPLLAAGAPLSHEVRSLPFLTAAEQFAGADIAHSTFKNTGAFVDAPLGSDAIATFVDQMRASPTTANVVGFFPWGGVIAAIDATTTAVVHRRALYDIQYQAYWFGASDEAADVAWVRDIRTAMLPYTNGTYVNYIDADISDWATAYYGANLPRLMRVKTRYDPDNVFNGPQSIPSGVS